MWNSFLSPSLFTIYFCILIVSYYVQKSLPIYYVILLECPNSECDIFSTPVSELMFNKSPKCKFSAH